MKKILLAGVMACLAGGGQAATWNVFQRAWNQQTVYFFDSDTVEKQGEAVTVWIKYVRDLSLPAEQDGSHASAMRTQYNCVKRTSQPLAMSIYDKNHDFIRSSNRAGEAQPVLPDSIGEEILKVVCAKDFPNSKSEKDYYKVKNNDIFAHTSGFYEFYKTQRVDQAPK